MSRETIVPIKPYEFPPEDPERIEVDGEFVAFRGDHKNALIYRAGLADFLRPLWEKLTDGELEELAVDIHGECDGRWTEGLEEDSFISIVRRTLDDISSEKRVVVRDGERIVFDVGGGFVFSAPIVEFSASTSAMETLRRMAMGNLLTLKHIEQIAEALGGRTATNDASGREAAA